MADVPPPVVTGTHKVSDEDRDIPHEEGFRHALADALRKAGRESGWEPGIYEDVKVDFFATIEVVNPGRIVGYSVKLTPGG